MDNGSANTKIYTYLKENAKGVAIIIVIQVAIRGQYINKFLYFFRYKVIIKPSNVITKKIAELINKCGVNMILIDLFVNC